MDLELTDEQRWIAESVETLLEREWPTVEQQREWSVEVSRTVWRELVAFGALTVGGDAGLGAVELCLIARSLGAHLAAVPFLGSAAVRLGLGALASELSPSLTDVLAGGDAIALALVEPGSNWLSAEPASAIAAASGEHELTGTKVAVEQLGESRWLAVSANFERGPVLVVVSAGSPGLTLEPRRCFDPSLAAGAAVFDRTPVAIEHVVPSADAVSRIVTVGALLAAAEAVGAASAVLELARRYAGERRQFGRTIGSFQALRHMLADMYVRVVSGWSAVLYAAAAFDDRTEDAQEVASIAKAYVSRTAREVAHGAMQVFGGIAFTAEHPAHLFLRRIVLREQQFGDASDHERTLGRRLARHDAGIRPDRLAHVVAR